MAYQNPDPNIDDEIITITENDADYTQINNVYFAFIDVLGFKKSFDDMKISSNLAEAEKYRNVFNYFFTLMNSSKLMERGKDTGCYAGQTSDSLYFYTNRTDYLLQFIKIFIHFNLFAMSQNVFLRGGIAKGTLFRKEAYQFFGNSVIGAYLLESNISKNPIVVIDENTHEDMCKENGYVDFIEYTERHYIKPFNHLQEHILHGIVDDNIVQSIEMKKIEDNITKNKAAFEYDASNYAKYVFLLNKFQEHNKKS